MSRSQFSGPGYIVSKRNKKKSTNIASQFTEVHENETLENVDDSNAELNLQHEEPEGPELLSQDWLELVQDTRGLVFQILK